MSIPYEFHIFLVVIDVGYDLNSDSYSLHIHLGAILDSVWESNRVPD